MKTVKVPMDMDKIFDKLLITLISNRNELSEEINLAKKDFPLLVDAYRILVVYSEFIKRYNEKEKAYLGKTVPDLPIPFEKLLEQLLDELESKTLAEQAEGIKPKKKCGGLQDQLRRYWDQISELESKGELSNSEQNTLDGLKFRASEIVGKMESLSCPIPIHPDAINTLELPPMNIILD